MTKLIDDLLLAIFKECDLNERTKLRLVNKRFKNLIDSILIKNLIVFEKEQPINGEYKLLNKAFNLKDAVCVLDLNRFFKSQIILDRMKNVKRLVIIGL